MLDIKSTNSEYNDTVHEYLNQLNNLEKTVLDIAQKELKTTFNIQKSIGFLNWLDNKK